MLHKHHRSASLIAAIAFAAASCQEGDPTGPAGPEVQRTAPGKGLTLLITDAPGDFKAAVVTISKIYLQGQGGPVVLREQPFTTDLLKLRDSFATLVQGLDVPAGSYSQLRLVVEDAYIEVETATGSRIFASSPNYAGLPAGANATGTLHMPSLGSSGLKVKLPDGKLDVGTGQTVVLIDFDIQESFGHEAGNSGRWIMHPVVSATDVTFGGFVTARLQLGTGVVLPTIAGQVLTLASFSARLTPVGGGNARTLTLTDANGDGVFEAMFKGLVPGQYTLDFVVPTGLLATFGVALPITITVAENQTVTQTVTLTGAAQPGAVTATLNLAAGVTLPSVGGNPVTLGQFKARLTPPGGGTPREVTFTDANSDGTFEAAFPGLVAGQYTLTVVAPTGVTATYNPVSPVTVDVTAGAALTRAFTVTAATSP